LRQRTSNIQRANGPARRAGCSAATAQHAVLLALSSPRQAVQPPPRAITAGRRPSRHPCSPRLGCAVRCRCWSVSAGVPRRVWTRRLYTMGLPSGVAARHRAEPLPIVSLPGSLPRLQRCDPIDQDSIRRIGPIVLWHVAGSIQLFESRGLVGGGPLAEEAADWTIDGG